MTAPRIIAGLLIVALCITGLVGSGCNSEPQGQGTVRILVTDKPFPVDLIQSAVITITKIELRRAGGGVRRYRPARSARSAPCGPNRPGSSAARRLP